MGTTDDRCTYRATDPETTRTPRADGYRCGHQEGHTGNHELFTTDPTPLQERLARVIYGEDPKWGYIQAGDHHGVAWETLPEPIQHDMLGMAADVLPIIRKAQADALRDAAREEFQFSPNVHYQGIRVHERLVKRADRIEKGTDHD